MTSRCALPLALSTSLLACFVACGSSSDSNDDSSTVLPGTPGAGGSTAGAAGNAIAAGHAGASGSAAGGSGGAATGGTGGGAGSPAAGGSAGVGAGGAGNGGAVGGGGGAPGGHAGAGGANTGGAAGSGTSGGAGTGGAGTSGGAGMSGGAGSGGSSATGGAGVGQGGGSSCTQPDVLVTLDRTLTMHFAPDGSTPTDAPAYASSKWAQAIGAIKQVTAQIDQSVRFGLELWPKDPGMGCITLGERILNTQMASNPQCQEGQILVPLGLGTSGAIDAALDPLTTKICISTPTGQALITASDYLTANAVAGRPQFVALVTDGADWDQSCPTPDPLGEVQKLADKGIKTFVVGFYAAASAPGGVGIGFLNDMACSGQTAKGFPGTCKQVPGGWVAADPASAPIFLTAEDGAQLENVLATSLGAVGCKP